MKYQDKNLVTWLNIDGLYNPTLMSEIATVFELDDSVLTTVMNTTSRPAVYEHDNCILISIKMLQLNEDTGLISVENLSLILTKSVLISFQENKGMYLIQVENVLEKRIRNGWTNYLAFFLLNIAIDNYIYIIGVLGEK